MLRQQLVIVVSATLIASCGVSFRERRTPSGEFCSDMAVIPAGHVPDREYHRLQPITSNPEARTEAQRLESLRMAACEAGGDGVIEAVNEEIRQENGNYATVASGTAVTWVLRAEGAKPISTLPTHSRVPAQPVNPEHAPDAHPPAPAPTETAAPAAPQPTAAPKAGPTSTVKAVPVTGSTARPPTPLTTTPPGPGPKK
jgi:hypothetical protein